MKPPKLRPLIRGKEYRVLSVHPPWAWAIIFAGKNIENRSWTTRYRGDFLVHASSRKYVGKRLQEVRALIAKSAGISLFKVPNDFPPSQILGAVELVDCETRHRSPWAFRGEQHWVLERPRALARPILHVDGKLGLWRWKRR